MSIEIYGLILSTNLLPSFGYIELSAFQKKTPRVIVPEASTTSKSQRLALLASGFSGYFFFFSSCFIGGWASGGSSERVSWAFVPL